MLDMLITSRTRRKLLGFFIINPVDEFYLHQLGREIEESAQSVRSEINLLVKAGFILSSGAGRERRYRLNENFRYLPELKGIVDKLMESGYGEFNFTDHARKKLLEKNLAKVTSALIAKYNPQKIILFGSLARGKTCESSDIDLLIVKDTHKPYFERIKEVIKLCSYDVGIDFFIYNPAEFQGALKTKSFLRDEMIKKGKVLYDKGA
jgi:predicted nucleotidyltransferase